MFNGHISPDHICLSSSSLTVTFEVASSVSLLEMRICKNLYSVVGMFDPTLLEVRSSVSMGCLATLWHSLVMLCRIIVVAWYSVAISLSRHSGSVLSSWIDDKHKTFRPWLTCLIHQTRIWRLSTPIPTENDLDAFGILFYLKTNSVVSV